MTFAIRLRIHSEAGHGFGVKLIDTNGLDPAPRVTIRGAIASTNPLKILIPQTGFLHLPQPLNWIIIKN
ncbi:MAG: hypothetical protein ACFKPT_19725 [Gloeotrichia echinulata GP01]